MKKVLDNSSGFFQLLQYSTLPLPSTPASSHLPPQHPTSPSTHMIPNLIHDAIHSAPPTEHADGGPHAPLSRTNSNSSEPPSPPPPSSPPHTTPQSSQLFARLAAELSSCVSSISSGNAQCRSMLPILFEFVVHGEVRP
jgi:hypothetical protein